MLLTRRVPYIKPGLRITPEKRVRSFVICNSNFNRSNANGGRERERLFGNGFSQVELKILPKKTKILHSIGVLVCCFSHLKVRLKCRASVKNISEWQQEQETSPPYGNLVSSSVSAALCIRHDQAQI